MPLDLRHPLHRSQRVTDSTEGPAPFSEARVRDATSVSTRHCRYAFRTGMCLFGIIFSGCGYVVGSSFGPEVRTVHVPTFTSDSFRRGFETRLTEAVHKQIQLSPFRLAKPPYADTRLTGRILSIDKRMANQNRHDDPRELELSIAVELTWEDLRSGRILAQREVPLDAPTTQALVNTSFAPEVGQSLATATQDAVDQLARQIVGMMEAHW